jgi:hypothetical protein
LHLRYPLRVWDKLDFCPQHNKVLFITQ